MKPAPFPARRFRRPLRCRLPGVRGYVLSGAFFFCLAAAACSACGAALILDLIP